MCGRFVSKTESAMEQAWATVGPWYEFEDYNVAPTHAEIPVIALNKDGERDIQPMHWPLRPVWSKGEPVKYKTHNARSESMKEKASFKLPWARGWRCLIPVVGFYEWQGVEGQKAKQPWFVRFDSELPSLAGLWCYARNNEDQAVLSCTIITMEANDLMSRVHNAGEHKNRMPLILDTKDYDQWLSGTKTEAESLIKQFPSSRMEAWPVSTYLNNPSIHDVRCMEKVSVG